MTNQSKPMELIDKQEAIRIVADFDDWLWCKCSECCADAGSHAVDTTESLVRLVESLRSLPSVTETKWQPIETAPRTGRTLLLGYPNRLGKWRTVRGQWFTNEEIGEWENGDDFRAGWYETSEENDEPPNCWLISPTHWMPLPAPPIIQAGASPKERNSTTVPDHGQASLPESDSSSPPE